MNDRLHSIECHLQSLVDNGNDRRLMSIEMKLDDFIAVMKAKLNDIEMPSQLDLSTLSLPCNSSDQIENFEIQLADTVFQKELVIHFGKFFVT